MSRFQNSFPSFIAAAMASFIFIAAAQNVWADTVTVTPSLKNPTLHRVLAEPTKFKGRDAVQITEDPKLKSAKADRLAIVPGAEIDDGVIEISLAGEPAKGAATGARGFVGIAFRVANDQSEFELVYFRPTNGRADDQLRRNHTVQYDAFPDYPWHKLRRESPGKYESYVDTVPGEWTDVKIEVKGTTAKVYAHGAKQPCLVVNDLKLGESKGAVALWIGPGTVAHFSDLRISDGF